MRDARTLPASQAVPLRRLARDPSRGDSARQLQTSSLRPCRICHPTFHLPIDPPRMRSTNAFWTAAAPPRRKRTSVSTTRFDVWLDQAAAKACTAHARRAREDVKYHGKLGNISDLLNEIRQLTRADSEHHAPYNGSNATSIVSAVRLFMWCLTLLLLPLPTTHWLTKSQFGPAPR